MSRRSDRNAPVAIGDILTGLNLPEAPRPALSPRPVTKRDHKRVDGVLRIRAQREEADQQVGYLAKPFLLLGPSFPAGQRHQPLQGVTSRKGNLRTLTIYWR